MAYVSVFRTCALPFAYAKIFYPIGSPFLPTQTLAARADLLFSCHPATICWVGRPVTFRILPLLLSAWTYPVSIPLFGMFKSVRFDGLFRASSFRRLLLFARPCAVIGMLVCDKLTQHSAGADCAGVASEQHRSEEHTSELQSLMRISYAVFCLKKKKT